MTISNKTKSKKIILIFLVLAGLIFSYFLFQKDSIYENKLENIEINGNKFKIEIVDSPPKMAKGLGERNNLCENCGMLFEFQKKEKQSFWMKGMRFPLDIIWINGENIVYISKEVPFNYQGTITPENPADKVLEIKAGLVDRLGIKEGDEVKLD